MRAMTGAAACYGDPTITGEVAMQASARGHAVPVTMLLMLALGAAGQFANQGR
jgi:hypothetical protein